MEICLRKTRGLTLIELLIALAISSILTAGLYGTFIGQQKTYAVQEQVVDMQQNVRAGINKMVREIRMAGFGNVSMLFHPPPVGDGPPNGPGQGVTIGGTTYEHVVNPDTPVAGSVTILSGIGSTTLTATANAGSNNITVNSLTDSQGNTLFDTGDRKYISIGGVESQEIKDIQGTTLTLKGNLINTHQVDGTHPPVFVFAIRAVSYQVDGTLTWLRDEIPRPSTQLLPQPQPLADNIENIQFTYFDSNGNPTAIPANVTMISLAVTARTDMSDPNLKGGDGYRRRIISSNVQLRDFGLTP